MRKIRMAVIATILSASLMLSACSGGNGNKQPVDATGTTNESNTEYDLGEASVQQIVPEEVELQDEEVALDDAVRPFPNSTLWDEMKMFVVVEQTEAVRFTDSGRQSFKLVKGGKVNIKGETMSCYITSGGFIALKTSFMTPEAYEELQAQIAAEKEAARIAAEEEAARIAAEEAERLAAEEAARLAAEEAERKAAEEAARKAAEAEAKKWSTSFANSASAVISGGGTIRYTASLPETLNTDDNVLYLYGLQVYEYSVSGDNQLVASCGMTTNPDMSFGYDHSRLYQKYALAVKKDGKIKMIAEPQFITNPEAVATNTHGRQGHGLKGMQGDDFYNVPIAGSDVVAPNLLKRVAQFVCYGTDSSYVNGYAYQADSHPVTPTLYMLNANDAGGVQRLIDKFEYYAANAYNTDDWIIGNEVNVRFWNYMSWQGWDEYMKQYEQVFRIAYIAIKSKNANANVYTCIDQNWDRNRKSSHKEYYEYIDGKDFLTQFNNDIKKSGNIDWGVSQHPWTVPLTYAKFWDMSECADGAYCANQVSGNKMVSFQNLGVISSFLDKKEMKSPTGNRRHFIISEIGISNTSGGDVQAAALCASYMAAARNGVEQIIYVSSSGGGVESTFTSQAQDMYNNLDDSGHQQWAMDVIGISDWGQVLR